MASPQPVLQFDVEYPDRPLSRLTTLFRGILALPHYIIVGLFGTIVEITTFLAWFAILFTGRYPRGLWNLAMQYLRWDARFVAYIMLMRDEYPPFGEGPYPVTCDLDYAQSLSRWKIFFKLIFAIPHYIVLTILGFVAYLATFIAWVAILITGRYPQGLFNFNVGVTRWSLRLTAYLLLLTDAYPPFSMAPVPSPTMGYAGGAA